MSSITLKGSKEGFSVIVDDSADFDEAISDLKNMIVEQTIGTDEDDVIRFAIKTGNRLFDKEQIKKIKSVFGKYPQIELTSVDADVQLKSEAAQIIEDNKVNIETGIVRSGQKKDFKGDLIFLGTLHEGAQITTTGSIYILGEVHGIVHAGFPDDTSAAILGNLEGATQVRIADVVEIVTEDNSDKYSNRKYAHIDDLHSISVDDIQNFKESINEPRKRND
ncbi:septum site-determining protein MinC [Companilactobacillus mishanensis]|uniref:Probable septum site-determining protein MinC n=1 Tax=Companilactobacillus mishanensis TaxID=2486008 RepID=A0A5P0ZGR1_9LACO|nr:septum site-determining protein MinC [Companilactobacillus mishanensis]MQS52250.1 septum formation initiator [Companilactobacillus mishanensis]